MQCGKNIALKSKSKAIGTVTSRVDAVLVFFLFLCLFLQKNPKTSSL